MAEAVFIPPPSVFLQATPLEARPQRASTSTVNANASDKTKSAKSYATSSRKELSGRPAMPAKEQASKMIANGVNKKKQSKSRNGCVTCKAKRLKCDETKPTCQQCNRRNVSCGGYHKDFKWRAFEEVDYTAKAPASRTKKPTAPTAAKAQEYTFSQSPSDGQTIPNQPLDWKQDPRADAKIQFADPRISSPGQLLNFETPPMMAATLAPAHEPFDPGPQGQGQSIANTNLPLSNDNLRKISDDSRSVRSFSSGQSPSLADLLLPGTDMSMPNPEYLDFRSRFPDSMFQPSLPDAPLDETTPDDEDDVEDIVPVFSTANPDHEDWVMRLPTPPRSGTSSNASAGMLVNSGTNPWTWMVKEPLFSNSSPEMLSLRFDRETCGVLSVKDGPTENPWRTLIWPLARDNSALYHAIASMTSFHNSKDDPQLRIRGIEHMRTSIKALAEDLNNMNLETAIATTLALAFSESWDQHISTGINHIKGAKTLVNRALFQHRLNPFAGEKLSRYRFLVNTWIYMDVLARLTCVDEDESNDFEVVFSEFADPFGSEIHLDPLMGCAGRLFPIIGRVTNLVRKVRRLPSNSPSIISQAIELKEALETWMPPAFFERPEDPSTEIEHGLQTAEAYRWATLLYLHQAVPEIPSTSSAELGKKVMVYLATVPLSSRTVIVQIYPLLAAGCEATDTEDRQWVSARWLWMARRMKLGIIDRCAEVVKEVWDRRDEYQMLKSPPTTTTTTNAVLRQNAAEISPATLRRGLSCESSAASTTFDLNLDFLTSFEASDTSEKRQPGTGVYGTPINTHVSEVTRPLEVDPAYTVRGRLHWISVMKEWKWEVLLG